MEIFRNVRIIDLNLDRNKFTRHGLHLNNLGKQLMGEKIMSEILDIIASSSKDPIVMDWTRPCAEVSTEEDDNVKGTADRGDLLEGDDDVIKGTMCRVESAEDNAAIKETADRTRPDTEDSMEEDDDTKGTTQRGDLLEGDDDVINGIMCREDQTEDAEAINGTVDRRELPEVSDVEIDNQVMSQVHTTGESSEITRTSSRNPKKPAHLEDFLCPGLRSN
ncbi:hypothetical protein ANN_06103 [Periplaneta americana]|uniref:Uncharacterized protein n=1 Tax=Periplaneta americana TaxID=6978 RepID=A0ABQ8TCM6_PERAM|nr:hypothetical protein ANN_06103 [Periplaneta americana]